MADKLREGCDRLTVLGASPAAMWTVEGTVQDASGHCIVDLVLTRKSGWRTGHSLLDHDDDPASFGDVEYGKVLARLW